MLYFAHILPNSVFVYVFIRPTDVTLELSEQGKTRVMGSINLVLTLIPRTQEDKEQVILARIILKYL